MTEARELLLDLVDQGAIDARDALIMCLKWMSEAQVNEMLVANELETSND